MYLLGLQAGAEANLEYFEHAALPPGLDEPLRVRHVLAKHF